MIAKHYFFRQHNPKRKTLFHLDFKKISCKAEDGAKTIIRLKYPFLSKIFKKVKPYLNNIGKDCIKKTYRLIIFVVKSLAINKPIVLLCSC